MSVDYNKRLIQLAGIIRLTHSVDLNRTATFLGLSQDEIRKIILDASNKSTMINGRFISPTIYKIESDLDTFIIAFGNQARQVIMPAAGGMASKSLAVNKEQILKQLEKMFKASKRLLIDDVCSILGLKRSEVLST
ncbi:MAG: hypothetical protein ACTSXP_15150, partial [Promethearchaeota archaeon]